MTNPASSPLTDNWSSLVEYGRELRGLEYKTSMSWSDDATQLKTARAALAMSNIEDGGSIVFGVNEVSRGQFDARGVEIDHYDPFVPDKVVDRVNHFADPALEMEVVKGSIGTRLFVVVRVQPFRDVPTICKNNGGSNSEPRRGALYTRPFGKAESAEVRTQTEMREIIDRAVDRAVLRLLSRTRGFLESAPNLRDLLDQELEGLL